MCIYKSVKNMTTIIRMQVYYTMKLSIFVIFVHLCQVSTSSSSRSREDNENSGEHPAPSPNWYYPSRRPQHHRLQRYRPNFYTQSNGEDEHPSGYRQPTEYRQPSPQRRDPYGDPYAYAKHVS